MIDENKLIKDIKEWSEERKIKRTSESVISILESAPKISEWIPCSERLPEEKINLATDDFYEYQVTYKSDNVTDVRHYKFGKGHWWNGGNTVDEYVTAWQPLPEPYKEE